MSIRGIAHKIRCPNVVLWLGESKMYSLHTHLNPAEHKNSQAPFSNFSAPHSQRL